MLQLHPKSYQFALHYHLRYPGIQRDNPIIIMSSFFRFHKLHKKLIRFIKSQQQKQIEQSSDSFD